MIKKKTSRLSSREKVRATSLGNVSAKTIKAKDKILVLPGKLPLVLGLVLTVLAVGYLLRGLFIAAVVNGQPVFRLSLIREMERRTGSQTLESLITKNLILQQAKKEKVTVSKEEIAAEIAKIEENFRSQQQNLDEALKAQGMDRFDLEEQVRIQKMIEKMIDKDIEVSEEEVTKYLADNKAFLSKETTPEEQKKDASDQIRQRKLNEKYQSWISSLQQKAKIQRWVSF